MENSIYEKGLSFSMMVVGFVLMIFTTILGAPFLIMSAYYSYKSKQKVYLIADILSLIVIALLLISAY